MTRKKPELHLPHSMGWLLFVQHGAGLTLSPPKVSTTRIDFWWYIHSNKSYYCSMRQGHWWDDNCCTVKRDGCRTRLWSPSKTVEQSNASSMHCGSDCILNSTPVFSRHQRYPFYFTVFTFCCVNRLLQYTMLDWPTRRNRPVDDRRDEIQWFESNLLASMWDRARDVFVRLD